MEPLVNLHINLATTRADVKAVAAGYIGLLQVLRLVAGLAHDMECLADCFERIAPARKLQFAGKDPELAFKLLRGAAKSHT
jgi:hypothetical protein